MLNHVQKKGRMAKEGKEGKDGKEREGWQREGRMAKAEEGENT